MQFTFSHLGIPLIPNKMQGEKYERFKAKIVALLLHQRLETFMQERSAQGPWQPLSETHQARRLGKVPERKRDQPGAVKMLQDSGLLRQSFTEDEGPGSAFRDIDTVGDVVSLATSMPYARIQNEGGTINWPGTKNGFGRGIEIPAHPITIPARPIDQFTEQDRKELNELTENYING